jgi:hypothetical protein
MWFWGVKGESSVRVVGVDEVEVGREDEVTAEVLKFRLDGIDALESFAEEIEGGDLGCSSNLFVRDRVMDRNGDG